MDELERRLRSALTDMAGEVPASTDAWGEHERRMARRGRQARRRPILVVAAAAAVAALIMVPVLVFNSRGGGGGDDLTAANRPPDTSVTTPSTKRPSSGSQQPPNRATYQPGAGETMVIPPVAVMSEQADGGYRNLYAMVLNIKGDTMYCTGEGKPFANGLSQDDAVTKRNCSTVRAPKPGKVFWGKFQVSTQADSMGGYVFLAAKNTHHVVVRADNGTYATANRMGSGADFDLFFTYISGKTITNYTAKDAGGQTLEDA